MPTTGHETEAINVRGLKASLKKGGNIGIFNECICSTAGGTAAKVTNTVPPSFSLVSGAKIIVKFTYAVTVANATLQVGETAAKPINFMGSALNANVIKAGMPVLLSYDGTAYNIIGGVGGNDVDVNYDTTNKKITKTINGVTSDVVTAETLATDGGVYTKGQTDTLLAAKADKTATVSSVTYDSSANMLKQTINGVTTDITSIVQSGFVPQFNSTTGIMELNPVGGATIAPNATTGIIKMTF